jgi:uncharacterized repeat protein (TIGR01451 family)
MAVVQASFLATTVLATPLAVGTALAANPSANLDQCANDPAPSPHTNGCATSAPQWVNGNLNGAKSVYLEGDSIPYRMTFDNLVTGATDHTVTIQWDTTKSGKHAIDYLTTWNRTVADSDPCLGVSGCSTSTTFPIPVDPQVSGGGVTPVAGNFTFFGATITSVSAYTYPDGAGFAGDKTAQITISFTADVANPVLAWGGHIASRGDWGANNSAVAISGSPYHMRLIDLDGAGGNQDRSLSEDAVIFPASITIIKDAVPNSPTNFSFTETGGLTPATFTLDDDADPTLSNTQAYTGITAFTTYTFTETATAAWDLTNRQCSVTSPNGGTQDLAFGATGISIVLKEGENVTCTFTNEPTPAPSLNIVKTVTAVNSDTVAPFNVAAAGDVIHYSITVFNTGNVTLTGVSVSDPRINGNLDCDTGTAGQQTTGFTIAVGASLTCTGTYTVLQSDIDTNGGGDGDIDNTATADSDQTGPDTDSASVPLTQSPELTTVKLATESSFSAAGDVIHYTITVSNTGNVTLTNVAVTDTLAVGLDCDAGTAGNQTTGFTINVGEHITCTATHVVTQADVDAGTYLNTACADDGVGGAAEACDSVSVPGSQNPSLNIVKTTESTGFDSVGDVISYTITATNSGNVTLHDVVVTDPNGSNLVCVPATPVADLAPGDSIDCTANHTIVQADLDAGSFFNQACVDDGDGPAASVCDDVTTTGSGNPDLTITKDATETAYSNVGDVIHYTIVATNSGNVTLHGVVVTDPNVTDLVCDPATPVDLAPGESITCSASHTVTQADLDARHFLNAACVDDNDGPATEACDDADVPAHTGGGGGETTLPTQPPTNGVFGEGSGPSDSAWLLVIAFGFFLAGVVTLTPARIRRRR